MLRFGSGAPPGSAALRVEYSAEATSDLLAILDLIARESTPERAEAYALRIERRCEVLGTFPLSGSNFHRVRSGLRTLGFERRVSIAYIVHPNTVLILRILYAGREF